MLRRFLLFMVLSYVPFAFPQRTLPLTNGRIESNCTRLMWAMQQTPDSSGWNTLHILGIKSTKNANSIFTVGTVQVSGQFVAGDLFQREDGSFVLVCHFDNAVNLPDKVVHSKGGLDGLIVVFKDQQISDYLVLASSTEDSLSVIHAGPEGFMLLGVAEGDLSLGSDSLIAPRGGMWFYQVLVDRKMRPNAPMEAPAETVLDHLGNLLRDGSQNNNPVFKTIHSDCVSPYYEFIQEDVTPHDPGSDDD